MTVKEFWDEAFLALLERMPAEEAKKEADLATDACIEHWSSDIYNWAPLYHVRFQDQPIVHVTRSLLEHGDHYTFSGKHSNEIPRVDKQKKDDT